MNLLYITPQNLSLPGGARSHVLGFRSALERLGVNVKLMAGGNPDGKPSGNHPENRLTYTLNLYQLQQQIIRCLRSQWPDILYYRKGLVDLGFTYATRQWRGPLYMEVNGSPKMEAHRPARYWFNRFCGLADRYKFRKADLLISVTAGIRDQLLEAHPGIVPEKIIVVSNGVDTETFYPRDRDTCRSTLGIGHGIFTLVFSGKIAKWHGLETALDAVALLKQKYPDRIRLYMIGDGPAARELQNQVKVRGLEDTVIFKGLVDVDSVSTYIGAADVCIAPFTAQRNDTIGISPLKIFEYAACQRPVVTTRVKGLQKIKAEIGREGDIMLVRPDDGPAFAGAIEQVLQRPDRDPATVSTARLHAKISWDARAKVVYHHIVKDVPR